MDEAGLVLLVEDDANILRINRRILERAGYAVLCAETLAQARAHLAAQTPDVLVLDIMLPDGSGLDFCAEVRDTTAAPVLFLTALDERHEVIQGLVAGGNDYITKPYDVDEFAARVGAQLRLARLNQQRAKQTLTLGPLTLDMIAQRAFLHGKDMLLQPREWAALMYLAQNEGKSIPARQLYEAVWRLPMQGNANAVKTVLSRLRRKLTGSGYIIASRRGDGYCIEKEEQ